MFRRALPFVFAVACVAPQSADAQSSMGGGAAAGLDRHLERQRKERELDAAIKASEREHELRLQALALEEHRFNAATAMATLLPITEEEYRSTGLYKLTNDERRALFAWFTRSTNATSSLSRPVVAPAHPVASEIDGDFDGFDYGKVFKLANGEIWQQTSVHYTYHFAYRPNVIIYRQTGTTYRMRVDGVRGEVNVERLK